MSIRLRIVINSLAVILVLSALSMTAGFLLFWFIAEPYAGAHLLESMGHITAQYFPLGGLAVLVLTAIGALWILGVTNSRVINPLQRIKRAASEIRDGNLSYELAVSGHDEFTELAAAFEQMRVRLRDSMRRSEKADMERRAMIASVTHDLKTPITSVMGYADGILDGIADTPEKTREYATVIRKKAKSLQILSEDLSLLSRLENAQLPLDRQDVDLGELVSEIITEFTYNEPDIRFNIDINSDIHASLDREKMARVIANLFQNSVKYKKPGLSGPEISVTLIWQDREALLTVSDNGMGIAQSELGYVFDQFYRADASRGRQSGSGLGLSIARYIVQLHGGKIWIVNNSNDGISVNISLPLA